MKVMLSLIAVVVLLLVMSSLAMAKPAKPSGAPAPVAPTPAAPATPVAKPTVAPPPPPPPPAPTAGPSEEAKAKAAAQQRQRDAESYARRLATNASQYRVRVQNLTINVTDIKKSREGFASPGGTARLVDDLKEMEEQADRLVDNGKVPPEAEAIQARLQDVRAQTKQLGVEARAAVEARDAGAIDAAAVRAVQLRQQVDAASSDATRLADRLADEAAH